MRLHAYFSKTGAVVAKTRMRQSLSPSLVFLASLWGTLQPAGWLGRQQTSCVPVTQFIHTTAVSLNIIWRQAAPPLQDTGSWTSYSPLIERPCDYDAPLRAVCALALSLSFVLSLLPPSRRPNSPSPMTPPTLDPPVLRPPNAAARASLTGGRRDGRERKIFSSKSTTSVNLYDHRRNAARDKEPTPKPQPTNARTNERTNGERLAPLQLLKTNIRAHASRC